MTETYSRCRQEAEIAFGKTQSEFFARGQASNAAKTATQLRDEKTQRLRKARQAQEWNEQESITKMLISKPSHKAK